MLRYKFSGLNFINPLTKIPTQAHKLFWAHINITHIYYQNTHHDIGFSQIFHAQAHKLPWVLSQILPIIGYILSNLGFHKNTHHIANILSHKIINLYKKPKSIYLVGKSKKPNKTLLQSPLLHGTLTKPIVTRHSYKACCYMALLQSPLLHGNIFTKSYKTQILIWHYFTKPKC